MQEKKNNSNNPSETQPMDEMGRYARKSGDNSLSFIDDDGITFDGLDELDGIPEEFDMEGLEDLDDIPEDFAEEKKEERFSFDYDSINIFDLSQEQAKKEADEIAKAINSNGWANVSSKFVSTFQDKRSAKGCLLALQKVVNDFPQLAKLLGQKVDFVAFISKSKYSVTWGDAMMETESHYDFQTKKFQCNSRPAKVRMLGSSFGFACPCTGTTGEFAKKYQKSSIHDTLSTPEEAVLATMFHECGHIISYEIAARELGTFFVSDNKELNKTTSSKMSEIRNKIIGIALEEDPSLTKGDLLKDTSAYGMSNVHEWLAETFASLYTKSPRKSALAMKKYLEEVYK